MSDVTSKGVSATATVNGAGAGNAPAAATAPGPSNGNGDGGGITKLQLSAPANTVANNNQGNGKAPLSQRARQMLAWTRRYGNDYNKQQPVTVAAPATGSSSGQIANLIFQWFIFLTLSVAVPILVGKFLPGYANTALTSCLWTLGIFGGIFIVIAGISIMMNVYKTDGLPITIMAGILGAYLSPIIVICYWVYHFIGYFFKWERHPYFGLFPMGIYSNNRWRDLGLQIFHDSRYYYDASYNLMTNYHRTNEPDAPADFNNSIPKSYKGWEGGYPDLLKKANGILYGNVEKSEAVNPVMFEFKQADGMNRPGETDLHGKVVPYNTAPGMNRPGETDLNGKVVPYNTTPGMNPPATPTNGDPI